MTAEIAVLNAHGVAMAADSAVSIGSHKIYNSAIKLFALTKKQPVGIMIYGNAQIMNVPWEALIKTYRKQLKEKKFDKLVDYGNDFINYLSKTSHIATENENVYINGRIDGFVNALSNKIVEEDLKKEFEKNPELTGGQISEIISELMLKYCKNVLIKDKLPNISKKWVNSLKDHIKPTVDETVKKYFENVSLSDEVVDALLETCASFFYANRFSENHSGIVISGFGDSEIYPSLVSYEIEWRVRGILKFRLNNEQNISVKNNASIVPFAQREMVDTFMEGCDRRLIEHLNKEIDGIFKDIIEKAFKNTSIRVGKKNLPIISENCDHIKANLAQNLKVVQNINFVQPVLDSVAALPLDELASMAETLINMTSFKRKVSMDPESVGGPIDVAVISKGDGFIWINRKHYFRPELNQHYISQNS